MATVIPSLSTIRGMTPGERRLGQRRYPDYIILHPGEFLLFLEAKDWNLDTLKRITPRDAHVYAVQGLKTVSNPLGRAHQSALLLGEVSELKGAKEKLE